MAKRMTAQGESHKLNSFDPVFIIGILDFKLASNTNGVHEGVSMRLLHFYMNKTAFFAVLNERPNTECMDKTYSRMTDGKSKYSTTYPQVGSFYLKKYATNEVNVEIKSDIKPFAQPSYMKSSHYAKELVAETLHRERVYEEYAFVEIFIKGQNSSIFHIIRGY